MSVHDLINRFATAEAQFRTSEFLAPVIGGSTVFVRVAGIVCQFRVRGLAHGWGVFRPQGKNARFVRHATLTERQRYLNLFPKRPLILVAFTDDWLAWPAQQADTRFGSPALGPVRLAEEVQRFDRVVTRFDGVQCWYEAADERADLAAARYLRDCFADMMPPEKVARPRLTVEQRTAYRLAYELHREATRDRTEDRLRSSLEHAGAEYRGHVEQADTYQIEFTVDGVRHVSVINKTDFGVQLAGICLNGDDQHFDLTSLVGVLREADGAVRIGDMNDGMAEEQYWAIHPPR